MCPDRRARHAVSAFAELGAGDGRRPRQVAFAGFAAMLPISAGFVGTSMQTFNRLMIFQNWI
jgi:hypothetical protein